jgi:hypothetical protein
MMQHHALARMLVPTPIFSVDPISRDAAVRQAANSSPLSRLRPGERVLEPIC